MRFLAILTIRNEAAFLLDWIAHHKAVGFTDILVFSNNCADGSDAMLDRLEALGQLVHIRNEGPYHNRGVQFTALEMAPKLDIYKNADWILPLDIDEFVNIHVGDHTLGALLAQAPQATAFPLTWRLFGNDGVVSYSDAPVTQRFTRAAPKILYWPWRASMFKTLYKNDGVYRKPGVHRPRGPDPSRLAQAKWVDGSGRVLPDHFKTKRVFSDYGQDNYQLAQLNHYPLGDMQSYILKCDRGRAVHSEQNLGMDYWVERNLCTDHDSSIHALKAETESARAAFIGDPDLARLHAAAVQWRHDRFRRLMGNELFRALFGRLLMTPPSHPVPLLQARNLLKFATQSQPSAARSPSDSDAQQIQRDNFENE